MKMGSKERAGLNNLPSLPAMGEGNAFFSSLWVMFQVSPAKSVLDGYGVGCERLVVPNLLGYGDVLDHRET